MADIAQQSMERYREIGIPVRSEYIARTTGREIDELGQMVVASGGPLNKDGSIRIDTSSATTAHDAAMNTAMAGVAPNRINQVNDVANNAATERAGADIAMGMGQQSRVLGAEQNVVRIGQGQQVQSIEGQAAAATRAQQQAAHAAGRAQQSLNQRQSLVGAVTGAGVAGLANRASQPAAPVPVNNTARGQYGSGTSGRLFRSQELV